jgi:glycosyltransferase involved in cell wall biosynthesis
LTCCIIRNLVYITFRKVYDIEKATEGKEKETVIEHTHDHYSTQIIIAALNEELGIGPTITELLENLHTQRVLVVDGKSHDRTVKIAKNHDADIVFQDGTGKGDAISKGLEHLDSNVDYIIFTDADYTYPAEYLPEMINILERNPSVGMVCGNRFNQHLDPKVLRNSFYFGNRLLAFVHNMLNGVALKDPLTGLRVVRAEILRDWQVKSKSFDVEVELNHQVERKGFKIIEVPIKYRQRLGEKKLKIKHGATILKRILLETTY